MKILAYCRLVAILLAIVGLAMMFPLGVALFFRETQVLAAFALPCVLSITLGIVFLFLGKKAHLQITPRNGFPIVASFWIFTCLFGAIPFALSGYFPSFTDAIFESVSGFTTTGASILSDVEILPNAINVWRAETHWLGGMGIVALTVALFPLIGVGGFQLIKAETTGPEKGKITPKITQTAKILWFIYVGFTILQTLLLMLFGMNFIDAIIHAFSTLGTGGFSNKNTSLAYYNSSAINWICSIFMFLAGINFSLYFQFFIKKGKDILHNSELKGYVSIVAVSIFLVVFALTPHFGNFAQALEHGTFQVLSIISTTGFITSNYALWPSLAQLVIFFLMFIGGCSGSTAGGIKVIRWVILSKQLKNEVGKMIHPHGIFSIRVDNRAGRKDIVFSVAAFIFLYFMLVVVTAFVATSDGVDILSALTSSLTMVGNIGPGFGKVSPVDNFAFYSSGVKWWFSFAMLAGRLELYTMLVFFMPTYWKK